MERDLKEQKFWFKQFKDQANMPEIWFMTAKELRFSYQVLAEYANKTSDIRLNAETIDESLNNTLPSSLMLAGYAMENYFKGVLVKKSSCGAFDTNGKFAYKGHNLIRLASSAEFELNDNEKELLEILDYFLMVGGRYPIPLRAVEMLPVVFKDGRIAPIGSQYYNHIQKRYCIYEKVDLFFEKLERLCPLINE